MSANQRDMGMNTVRVKKVHLVTKLKENRDIHIEDYDESIEGYKVELIKKITEKAKELGAIESTEELLKFNTNINLLLPRSYESEYSVTIEMLEWSIDDYVDLTQQEFKQYVKNEWMWSDAFVTTSLMYK